MYSKYAWSRTQRTCSGSRSRNASSSARPFAVPVGPAEVDLHEEAIGRRFVEPSGEAVRAGGHQVEGAGQDVGGAVVAEKAVLHRVDQRLAHPRLGGVEPLHEQELVEQRPGAREAR